MGDGTVLNLGSGGDTINNETVNSGTAPAGQKMAVTKIHTGAHGVDGDAVTATNPFFTEVVDGAGHTLPTGDAVARSIAVQQNDGTNVIGTAAHPVQTQIGDGAGHTMPAGDVAARAGFEKVTDGTNVMAVKAASTAAAATDPAAVVGISPNSLPLPVAPVPLPAAAGNSPSSIGTGATPAHQLTVKATAGALRSFYVMNRNVAARYLWIANVATGGNPTTGNVMLCPIFIPPNTAIFFDQQWLSEQGLFCSAGIVLGVSTSNTAYTAATDADHDIAATFM